MFFKYPVAVQGVNLGDLNMYWMLALMIIANDQTSAQSTEENVVVTGVRVDPFRSALDTCISNGCSVEEDIDATLKLAEALFINHRHQDARIVLRASLKRNKAHANAYPELVSGLHRANGVMVRHLGLDREGINSARDVLRTLQSGIPTEDHRHLGARLEIAQTLIELRYYEQAERELKRLQRAARQVEREDVAQNAEVRELWVAYLIEPSPLSIKKIREVADRSDPDQLYSAIGAQMLLIRIYGHKGDHDALEKAIAELAARFPTRRQLLSAPPFSVGMQEAFIGTSGDVEEMIRSDTTRMVGQVEKTSVDVSFWINADGHVRDLEIVQHRGSKGWEKPLLESIGGRRYSAAEAPSYRLERYTMTAPVGIGSRSRIPVRIPRTRVEYFDLTNNESN